MALVTLGPNFERASVFLVFFFDIVSLTGPLAFFIAATLIVIAVAYFDINAIVGARLQVYSLSCN
jgi:hypothetical protein